MNSPNKQSLFLRGVTTQEVISSFLSLRNSRATDAFGIQTAPVKFVIDIIASCLEYIFNLCLSTGVFPRSMQTAKVTVIFKKGDKNNLSNYRPVSVLPVFSKGLEKVILARFCSFTDHFGIISPAQFGFRKNRSTELALMTQKEFILQKFEEKKMVLGIFLDFSKAFDLISHDVLLKKLDRYGIRGVAHSLITSYLQHRSQFVAIAGDQSELKSVRTGVPQGSILGPYLFILYINDIVNVDPSAKCVIYADDTSLFFDGDLGSEMSNRANKTLASIQKWATSNCLKINVEKTKAVMFHPRNKQFQLTPIKLNNTEIEILSSFKSLGVYFSETMSWDCQVNHLVSKLSRAIGTMRRHCNYLPTSINMMLYNSMFLSLVQYGILVWGTTSAENIHKLMVLQKRAIRLVSRVPYLWHTAPLFTKLRTIKIESLYTYRLCRMYRMEKSKNDNALTKLASLQQHNSFYKFRHLEPWIVNKNRTKYGDQMLQFCLPTVLNQLYKENGLSVSTLSLKRLRDVFM